MAPPCILCRWAIDEESDNDLSNHILTDDGDPAEVTDTHVWIRRALKSEGVRASLLLRLNLTGECIEELQKLLLVSGRCRGCADRKTSTVFPLRRLLMRLSRESGILPHSLFLEDVVCMDKDAIAGGGYADIFRGQLQGQVVALKRLRTFAKDSKGTGVRNLQHFCREALVWCSMSHPNIHQLFGVDKRTFATSLCMVSPWQVNGNITECLTELKTRFGISVLVDTWIKQTVAGLCYLHSNDVVHGDLRPANVLIDIHHTVKLTDFGLAGFQGASSVTQGSLTHGAVRFCAPELMLETSRPTFASDTYAFACLCLELNTGIPPFPDIPNDHGVIVQLMKGFRPKRPTSYTASKDGFWKLMENCWSPQPSQRPTLDFLASSLPLHDSIAISCNLEAAPPLGYGTHSLSSSIPSLSTVGGAPMFSTSVDPCIVSLIHIDDYDCLLDIPSRLSACGKTEDAFQFLRATLQAQRSLAAKYPAHLKPRLSHSLHLLSVHFRQLGLYQEALVNDMEALAIIQESAKSNPEFNQHLADSHFVMMYDLRKLGRGEGGIVHAQEALKIYRHLVKENPIKFNPKFAWSLNSCAWELIQAGRHLEALPMAEQAVTLARTLCVDQPADFGLVLACYLDTYSTALLGVGRPRDAVATSSEAVEQSRDSVGRNPSACQPMLAEHLCQFAASLCAVGRREDALMAASEAIELCRQLNPDQYTQDLTKALRFCSDLMDTQCGGPGADPVNAA